MTVEQQRSVHLDARVMDTIQTRNLILARALFSICEEAELTGQTDETLAMPAIKQVYVEDDGVYKAFSVKTLIPTDDDRIMWYSIVTHKSEAGGRFGPFPRYQAAAERKVCRENDSSEDAIKTFELDEKGLLVPLKHALTALGVKVTTEYVTGKNRGPVNRPGKKS